MLAVKFSIWIMYILHIQGAPTVIRGPGSVIGNDDDGDTGISPMCDDHVEPCGCKTSLGNWAYCKCWTGPPHKCGELQQCGPGCDEWCDYLCRDEPWKQDSDDDDDDGGLVGLAKAESFNEITGEYGGGVESGMPFWIYILIALVIVNVVCIIYGCFNSIQDRFNDERSKNDMIV